MRMGSGKAGKTYINKMLLKREMSTIKKLLIMPRGPYKPIKRIINFQCYRPDLYAQRRLEARRESGYGKIREGRTQFTK